jgi:hypothetical protein
MLLGGKDKMENLKLVYLAVSSLKPYDKNTRKHAKKDVDNIAKSIEKYGFADPIGIWGEDNIIVEGHGRLQAAKKLGIKEVPCIRLDHLTEQERREYAIAHNATAELSTWDAEMLELELPELDLSEFEFEFSENFDFQENTETKERTEVSLQENISVVVECCDDEEAEEIFMKLSKEGYKCRISTL